jgi:hypothetical protein
VRRRLYALSYDDAVEIRELCQAHPQRRVALLFGVHESTVSRALRGLSWRSDGPAEPRRANAKLTPATVQEIKRSPLSLAALAIKYGVCTRTVHRARIGETWRTV